MRPRFHYNTNKTLLVETCIKLHEQWNKWRNDNGNGKMVGISHVFTVTNAWPKHGGGGVVGLAH